MADGDVARLALSLSASAAPAEQRERLFAEISRAVRARLGRLRPGSLCLLARAFASARVHDLVVLDGIAQRARGQLLGRFSTADLAHLVWAIATVRADAQSGGAGFPAGAELLSEAFEALGARVAESGGSALHVLSQREAAQLVWAFGREEMLRPGELATGLLAAVIMPPAERSATRAVAAPARQYSLLRIDARQVAASAANDGGGALSSHDQGGRLGTRPTIC